ncbi:MAG TPA: LegC family aminotransferase [Chitinophagaceae bacterium]|nr:LegC family aminotransferase [Chitinophagaceae bacterium]
MLLSGPNISGNEWKYVRDCLDTGWVSSVGSYVSRFENMLAEFTGCRYGIATSNGTAALHISLLLAGVQRGDYVIAPNVTFVASINSIKYTGADPILMDIDEETWQMDLDLLEEFLQTESSKKNGKLVFSKDQRPISAIMPVHVLGNMCDMERLMKIAREYGLVVVEDATEALGSCFQGRHSGSFGLFGCFSFNGNKIITTGGGGMIVTNDEALAKRAKHITTQAKSDAFEYIHDDVGYNYRLVNVLAAMGVAQMELLPKFLRRKKEIDAFYRRELQGTGDIGFQKVDAGVESNLWLFTISTSKQKAVLKTLNDKDMQSRPFWVPMNQLPMYRENIYYTRVDRSDYVYRRCLSIPCSTYISDEEMSQVAAAIRSAY